MNTDYRLFAWDFSYFSAKARAYFEILGGNAARLLGIEIPAYRR